MRLLLTCRGVLPWNEKLSGGQELYVMRLAEHLAMRKHDVHVVANCPDSTRDRLAREGVVVHQSRPPLAGRRAVTAGFYGWLWAHLWGNVAVSQAAATALREKPFDVVHCHGALSLLLIRRQFPDIPLAYTCHDTGPWLGQYPFFERLIRKAIFSAVDVQAIRAADQIVANFNGMKQHLVDRWAVQQDKITLVHNAVDTRHFLPAVEPLERHGVLFVGHLIKRKGADLLIPLAKRNPELNFTIIGDGPEREGLERRCVQFGLTERVRFLGVKANEDIRDYLVRSRVLVMPSRSDTMPQVMLESLSCAVPVVAFNAGGTGEVIRDGWNGFLADIEDLGTLEKGLRKLALGEPALSVMLGQNGHKMIEQGYSWHEVAKSTEDTYSAAVRAHLARPADAVLATNSTR